MRPLLLMRNHTAHANLENLPELPGHRIFPERIRPEECKKRIGPWISVSVDAYLPV